MRCPDCNSKFVEQEYDPDNVQDTWWFCRECGNCFDNPEYATTAILFVILFIIGMGVSMYITFRW